MTGVFGLLGLAVIVLVNTAFVTFCSRVLRLQLSTRWGPIVFLLVLAPIGLAAILIVLSGVVGLGTAIGSRTTTMYVTIVLPLAVGIAIDYYVLLPPEAIPTNQADST